MNLGASEIFLILIIVLVLFGANRLPGLGKSLGSAIKDFKKGLHDDERDVTSTAKSEQLHEPPQTAGQTTTTTTKTEVKKT